MNHSTQAAPQPAQAHLAHRTAHTEPARRDRRWQAAFDELRAAGWDDTAATELADLYVTMPVAH